MRGLISKGCFSGICLLVLTLVAGCSGEGGGKPASTLAPAKGVVKYSGKPVAGATVMFVPSTGSPAMGMTDAEGKFTVTTGGRPGAEIGKVKVTVTKAPADAKSLETMKPEDMQKMIAAGQPIVAPKSELPARYSQLDKTTLEADVTAAGESNDFEFNLVD